MTLEEAIERLDKTVELAQKVKTENERLTRGLELAEKIKTENERLARELEAAGDVIHDIADALHCYNSDKQSILSAIEAFKGATIHASHIPLGSATDALKNVAIVLDALGLDSRIDPDRIVAVAKQRMADLRRTRSWDPRRATWITREPK